MRGQLRNRTIWSWNSYDGSVEKFITENAWENGWVKAIEVKNERDESVGIIGAGPAGLACAEELRKQGIRVTYMTDTIDPGGF